MKIISVAAVTAGGKTTVVNEVKKKIPKTASLHFDDYSFDGEPEDFCKWAGEDYYNVWDLSPLKSDIEKIKKCGEYEYLLLDFPFAYRNDLIKDYIDCALFINTPLDIAMARRVLRDMGNASAEEIRLDMRTYLNCAREAYVGMIEDILPDSDYVIDGTEDLRTIVDKVVDIVINR